MKIKNKSPSIKTKNQSKQTTKNKTIVKQKKENFYVYNI